MKVLDPGHLYELPYLDLDRLHWWKRLFSRKRGTLRFVKREGDGYPGNIGHYPGTNIQDVLRALIDRVSYLQNQISCAENVVVLTALRDALYFLEKRAATRHHRSFPFSTTGIEHIQTCKVCGHIGCVWDTLYSYRKEAA